MQKTTRLKKPQVPEQEDWIVFDKIHNRPKYAGEEMTSETDIPSVTAETEARQEADQEIWTEIETIEASSDVVDVVGTYADLEAYDTSKLHDKDLIKVLADETRDNAITYYRYSTTTETFTYVGAEGPYYTASETDTLLSGKQDTLVAGSNIQIASDGVTISATDTTYSNFVGATSSVAGSAGLVPAPTTADPEKFLKGDGTWSEVASVVDFYSPTAIAAGSALTLYKDSGLTQQATYGDVMGALSKGIICINNTVGPETMKYYSRFSYINDLGSTVVFSFSVHCSNYKAFFFTNGGTIVAVSDPFSVTPTESEYTLPIAAANTLGGVKVGTNLSISSGTLSAKTLVGTDGVDNGTAGYAPAPTTSDAGKFLKADGTWATPATGPTYTAGSNISISAQNEISATDTTYSNFTGTDGIQDGNPGLVPGPTANDAGKFLNSDGTWSAVSVKKIFELSANPFTTVSVSLNNHSQTWQDVADAVGSGYPVYLAYPVSANETDYYTVVAADFNYGTSKWSFTVVNGTKMATIAGTYNSYSGTSSYLSVPKLYSTNGYNTDGAVTQNYFTQVVGDIETTLQILNHGAGV